MNKSICILSVVLAGNLAGFAASAEPEIKGTVSELSNFITTVPKTVMVTGEAEVRVPARRAVVSLKVVTENKSLQAAMRANLELRNKLTDYLKKQGISDENITASKFSSTPKFGMFSDKAKSYQVENEVRVSVQDENEFQAAAGVVDKWSEVQFDGVEFQYADKEAQKQNAIAKACDNARERKKIYEDKLGLKLEPVAFNEGQFGARNLVPRIQPNSAAPLAYNWYLGQTVLAAGLPASSADVGTTELTTSFGEMVYTARVAVQYTVMPK